MNREMKSKKEKVAAKAEDLSEVLDKLEAEVGSDDSDEGGDYNFDDDDDDGNNEEDGGEWHEESFPIDSGIEDKMSLKRKADGEPDKNVGGNKKRKNEETRLYKQPTVKELNQWKETENLFHSNLFRLQIEEMLKEVQARASYKPLVDEWIENFKNVLENIDESAEHDLNDCHWLKKLKVKLPLHQFPQNSGLTFKFVKPKSISVFGSYGIGCCLGPHSRIDVKIEVAQTCFDVKDYLNHRYHRKRALYLAYIAGKLCESELAEEMHFLQSGGNPLKPVLEIKPAGRIGKRMLIVVHLVPPAGIFKLNRFSPEKNNIRPHWYFEQEEPVDEAQMKPTPHYNNSIMRDLVANFNEEYSTQVLQDHSNLKDGIILLKVWLKQRGLDQGFGAFSGYIMSMYVLYLLQSRRINSVMSSYQVARNVWSLLSKSDWTREGISLATEQSPLSEFHNHFEVVFVDVTGFCNLCADMSKETFLWVKHECGIAINFLDNPNINSFQALFMTKMPFYRQFDHIMRITISNVLEEMVAKHSDETEKIDYMGHTLPQALNLILKLLNRGLGKRVVHFGILPPSVARWPVSEPLPPANELVTIGLVLNPDFAFSVLDKGPEANLPEAFEFREFWGRKSEVRRFRDGSIAEAVVWNSATSTLMEKRLICRDIVSYLLQEKLAVPIEDALTYIANQLDTLLQRHRIKPFGFAYGTGEEATVKVIGALDSLSKQLRQVEDIPLQVSTIQGISPAFRYSDVFPPLASAFRSSHRPERIKGSCSILWTREKVSVPPLLPLLEAIIQLEMSGKWPRDLGAVQRIKAAFYIKMAEGASKQFQLTAQPFPDCVQILKDGYVFRLCVESQREVALLKESTSGDGITKYRDTPESLALEKKTIHLPKLTGALHGIHQQYSAFGPTCCLAKRWLSSQLLDPHHFPEICTELLVASLFLAPEPYKPPHQPQLGFFHFLHLMANTNWHSVPIILNLNKELNREEVLEIENWFHANRKTLPHLFLSTPYDSKGSIWSKEAPTLQILIRVAMLAREALKVVESSLFSAWTDWKQIFRPPLDAYDVVIHLIPRLNPLNNVAVDAIVPHEPTQLPAYVQEKNEKIPVVGFNPVYCYLQELRTNYSDFALFFYDNHGGNFIAVLWKPSALLPREFKVSHINCCKPSADGSTVELNVEAIIQDFYTLGLGLVKKVVKSSSENSS